MIQLTREEAQQVLDALVSSTGELHLRLASPTDMQLVKNHNAIQTLRARLAEQEKEQEPVAKVRIHKTGGNAGISWSAAPVNDFDSLPLLQDGALLYTATPQREWVGLTDEELIDAADEAPYHTMVTAGDYIYILARAIEAKLKEKNI